MQLCWFKRILFRRKGLGTAYNGTMPSPEEVCTKSRTHHLTTHTNTHAIVFNAGGCHFHQITISPQRMFR